MCLDVKATDATVEQQLDHSLAATSDNVHFLWCPGEVSDFAPFSL